MQGKDSGNHGGADAFLAIYGERLSSVQRSAWHKSMDFAGGQNSGVNHAPYARCMEAKA